MSQPFTSPFDAALGGGRAAPERDRRRRDDILATQQALGHPAGRAWLRRRLDALLARPSYTPGDCFDHVAFVEGQKAALRAIQAELDTTLPPEED